MVYGRLLTSSQVRIYNKHIKHDGNNIIIIIIIKHQILVRLLRKKIDKTDKSHQPLLRWPFESLIQTCRNSCRDVTF